MYCKISNANVAKVMQKLRDVPYKYSADVIHLLEYSLQPLEEINEETKPEGVPEEKEVRQG